jgi:hypothetical protein
MDIEREPSGAPLFHYNELAARADEILGHVARGSHVDLHDGQSIVARIEPVTDPLRGLELAQRVNRLAHVITSAQELLEED